MTAACSSRDQIVTGLLGVFALWQSDMQRVLYFVSNSVPEHHTRFWKDRVISLLPQARNVLKLKFLYCACDALVSKYVQTGPFSSCSWPCQVKDTHWTGQLVYEQGIALHPQASDASCLCGAHALL